MKITARRGLLFMAAALVVGWAAPAGAATIIVLQTSDGSTQTIYADGKHLRMEMPGEKDSVAILDAAENRLLMINDREKVYTEISEADIKVIGNELQAMRAQLDERMKTMNAEQRKQVEQAMSSMPGGQAVARKRWEWKFHALGKKRTVNGMSCEVYRVSLDGQPHEEDCILPWSSNLLKRSDFIGLEELGRTLNESLGGPSRGQSIPLFHQFPGLPIARVSLEGGKRGPEEQVKTVKQGHAPAGAFSVPSGYRRKSLEGIGN